MIHLKTPHQKIDPPQINDCYWVSRPVKIYVPKSDMMSEFKEDFVRRAEDDAPVYFMTRQIYVAVVVAYRGFKVYYGDANRQSPETVRMHGSPLRDESVVRMLFPQLDDLAIA